MNRILSYIFILFFISANQLIAEENIMILKLKDGDVKIELFEDVAPNHVKRIKELANSGKYDNVVFHRVIDGFMAQTGDVKFGNSESINNHYHTKRLFFQTCHLGSSMKRKENFLVHVLYLRTFYIYLHHVKVL